ncbi:MAG: hypothetical protein D6814_08985 [Calditrichaeota bacterium]|nr:MAG: hypothetical protein D6814_08985 [Calditrichota bacterium]
MKNLFAGITLGLVLGMTIIALAGEIFYPGKKVYVVPAQENLRKAPNGEKLASLVKGTELVVLEDGDQWVKVGLTGYIWKESLTGSKKKLMGHAYRALMIVVKTEAEAKDILAKINAGQDFALLAKEKSIDAATAKRGGDLGEFYKGDFSPKIENAILSLKVNQVSGVIKTPAGYAIFKRIK